MYPSFLETTSRRHLAAAVSLLLAAIGAFVLLSSLGGNSSTASAESTVASYGALTVDKPAATTATDVRPALNRIAGNEPEVLGETARVITSVETGKVVLYSNDAGDVCLALASYTGSAQTTCEPRSKSNVSGVAFGGPVNRFGVVPDGVESVEFVLQSGARETVKVVDNFYVAPDDAVKGIFALDGIQQIQEFVPRSAVPAVGRSITDSRGATTTVEPDGTVSLAGPGVNVPSK